MKKAIFTLLAILTVTFGIANPLDNNGPASSAARQFGFYIGHGDAVKAELMVTNSEQLAAHIASVRELLVKHGGLKDVQVVQETVVEGKTHVTIAYVSKDDSFKWEQTYELSEDGNGRWKVTIPVTE